MSAGDRLQQVKEYARERLRKEIDDGPRGTQAALSKELEISSAHVANLYNRKSYPGEDVLPRLARHWGMTYDQLEATAMGEPVVSIERDAVLPGFRAVGKRADYSSREIEFASDSVRGLAGSSNLSEAKILELLVRARMSLRDAARVVRENESSTVSHDDELDSPLGAFRGGIGDAPPPQHTKGVRGKKRS